MKRQYEGVDNKSPARVGRAACTDEHWSAHLARGVVGRPPHDRRRGAACLVGLLLALFSVSLGVRDLLRYLQDFVTLVRLVGH